MNEKIFNLSTENYNGANYNGDCPGKEKEVDNADKDAFFFLTILFVLITTISIFKSEILQIFF